MNRKEKTDQKKDAKKQNMIFTCVFWSILCIGGMAVMLFAAARKPIVIADIAQEQTGLSEEGEKNSGRGSRELLFREDAEEKNNICIPLAKGTRAEKVVMENRYMEQELWIYLEGAEESFYEENAIYGDTDLIRSGCSEAKRDSVILKLQMQDVLEYKSTMGNDTLVIACYEPRELYRLIVVVDPAGEDSGGGNASAGYTEKEPALEVAKKLQKKLGQEDIKLYFTRLEDGEVLREDRAALVEAVHADIFLGIVTCTEEENPDKYGIQSYYNEDYFIPGFGNVQLADVLTRNVTIAAGNRAVGLVPAGKESILQDISVPAAQVSLGYLSNPKEKVLLQQESYQDKLTEGLANAVLEVYTVNSNE